MYGLQLSWPFSHGKIRERKRLTELFLVASCGLFFIWNSGILGADLAKIDE